MMARLVSTLRQPCRRLVADRRGISAVEFALLTPLMLTMYFGSIEVTDAISADRQVTLVASTVADITSEFTSVASADISNIMAASCAVLAPFSISKATITLTSVKLVKSVATVDWSYRVTDNCTTVTTGRTVGSSVTSSIPTALLNTTTTPTFVIWGETTYAYKPVIGYVVTGTLSMASQIFMRPRLSTCVIGPSESACPTS